MGDAVSPSIGAICFGPTEDDIDEVLRQADEQMYHVKSEGQKSVSVEDWTQPIG